MIRQWLAPSMLLLAAGCAAAPTGEAPAAAPVPLAAGPAEQAVGPATADRSRGAVRTTAALRPAAGSVAAAAAAYGSHQTFLGQGYARGPNGLALGANNALYEADFFAGTVTRVLPSGAATTFVSGIRGPAGLAFDPAGNLLVAGYQSNTLERVAPGGGAHTTFAGAGLMRPVWPAVDSRGTVYLADYSHNRIAKVAPDGTASTFFSMGGVNAIAIDPSDNLWVCAWSGQVAKVTPQGRSTVVASGLSTACGIAWSPTCLAVVTYGGERTRSGRLLLLDANGQSYLVQGGLDRASSVIFDRAGNVYTANCGDRALRKYSLQ